MKIHPTAIVEPGARLGEEVEIGPYACIGAEVEIGPRTIIQSHAVIEGAVRVGADNRIGHGAIIGDLPQDLSFKPGTPSSVEIGKRNVIGHNCTLGSRIIIANNCLLGGYVAVEDGAFLGGGCVFHQFMRIGRLAITQGRSGFSKDIPPFCLAANRNRVVGLNVLGLRRAGFTSEQRAEIREAFRLLYESGLNVKQALARAEEREWSELARTFFDFVAAAQRRGICGLARGRAAEEE